MHFVTPYTGVWIETGIIKLKDYTRKSHPTRVCGLKQIATVSDFQVSRVTPYTGVWIETLCFLCVLWVRSSHPTRVCGLKREAIAQLCCLGVTPYTGVWIETLYQHLFWSPLTVTPYTGVWIETFNAGFKWLFNLVTPYTGVWIETTGLEDWEIRIKSHPTRVCGLKLLRFKLFYRCHRSHPTRVCGLKLMRNLKKFLIKVTPYTGVWIETFIVHKLYYKI